MQSANVCLMRSIALVETKVMDIKRRIEELESIAPSSQAVYLYGQHLNDEAKLNDVGVREQVRLCAFT
jgi:hypothetical protein